jgi:GntR family transcriptional regulator
VSTLEHPPSIAEGPRSKHKQLRDALADLAVRELGPDEAIPSERVLMSTYGVSRSTVRKSIDSLVADGLLHRVHGKGTFVARPRLESRLHLASFSQDMRRRGLTPSTVLLGIEPGRPPGEVAGALELDDEALAWRLDRVRLADGRPIALENGWYPQAVLPDLDRQDLGGSLYEILRCVYGLGIDTAEQTLWGESADAAVARRLDAPLHTPLLVFRRISCARGRPLEHVVSRYRGDRYQIHMSLGSGPPGPGSTTHRSDQGTSQGTSQGTTEGMKQ